MLISKTLAIVFITFFVQTSFAKDKIETIDKKFFGFIKMGAALPNTKTTGQEQKQELFLDLELSSRYSINKHVGVTLNIGKWLGDTSLITNDSGGLSYQLSGAVIISLTGSLVDTTQITTKVTNLESKKEDDFIYTSKVQKRTVKNNFDGFRLSLHGSEFAFLKMSNPIFGWGGSVFYEHRFNDNYLQYGIKSDILKTDKLDATLYQGFVSFGF